MGPSDLPDPQFHAYRNDLADIALATCVIASHYAEPVNRLIVAPTPLRDSPSEAGSIIRELEVNENFALLDDSLGWAWGYAGADGRVGYVRSDQIGR